MTPRIDIVLFETRLLKVVFLAKNFLKNADVSIKYCIFEDVSPKSGDYGDQMRQMTPFRRSTLQALSDGTIIFS